MSVLCWLRGIALIPVVVAIAAGPSAGSAQVRFRAAVVYGDGIETPLVLQEDTAVARCFWWFTYNFYASRATGTYDGGPAATISFLTPDEWQAAGERGGGPLVPASWTGFHTRLLLAPLTDSIVVQYRKPRDAGFETRLHLLPSAEPYFALRGIPTRLDGEGRPLVREFSAQELTTLRAELLRNLGGDYLPECRY